MYAVCRALGGQSRSIDMAAMAVELIHTYSLVHDDLPAMDDDDMRRGAPTCHKVYGDAEAILVGDALQCMAFEILSTSGSDLFPTLDVTVQLKLIAELSRASGASGMVAGQSLDLSAEGQLITLGQLETIHKNKTGRLIEAAVQMAIIASGCSDDLQKTAALGRYAQAVGIAFQIQDDVLDVLGSAQEMGKPVGSDEGKNKMTFPSLLGIESAQEQLRALYEEMLSLLAIFGPEADLLRAISRYTVSRAS